MNVKYTKMTVREIIPTLADPAFGFHLETMRQNLSPLIEFSSSSCTTEHVEHPVECRSCENSDRVDTDNDHEEVNSHNDEVNSDEDNDDVYSPSDDSDEEEHKEQGWTCNVL